MIVERRITHHSICLDETILMSYSASFYDYWMPSYSAKRQIVQNLLIYPTHIGYPICTRYSALIIHISYTYRVPDISFFDQWEDLVKILKDSGYHSEEWEETDHEKDWTVI